MAIALLLMQQMQKEREDARCRQEEEDERRRRGWDGVTYGTFAYAANSAQPIHANCAGVRVYSGQMPVLTIDPIIDDNSGGGGI